MYMLIFLYYFSSLDEKTLYLTPEQEKDKSHFTDKEVFFFFQYILDKH